MIPMHSLGARGAEPRSMEDTKEARCQNMARGLERKQNKVEIEQLTRERDLVGAAFDAVAPAKKCQQAPG